MLDWQQATRRSSQSLYYLLQMREGVMHIAPYCFGATSLTQALQSGVFLPRLTRRSYSFPSDHQQSQKQANS